MTDDLAGAMSWKPSSAKLGVAIYNFDARKPHELSLEVGDVLHLLEECASSSGRGWYRGFCIRRKKEIGIFPISFVHLKQSSSLDDSVQSQSTSGPEDPAVEEVADVVRIWGDLLTNAYLNLQELIVKKLTSSMILLVKWRRDILHSSMRSDQFLRLKVKISAMIDQSNSQLGMEVVPRDSNYDLVRVDSSSVLEMYNVYSRPQVVEEKQSTPRSVHLYTQVSSISCPLVGEETDLLFSLYNAETQTFISERMQIRIGEKGNFLSLDPEKPDKIPLSWLFTDLDPTFLDQINDLYIVCHVVRHGRMDLNVKKASALAFRRPLGCAVFSLAKLRAVVGEPGSTVQVSSYMCPIVDEKEFYALHEQIIRRTVKSNDRNGMLLLNLCLVYGEHSWALDSYRHLLSKDTPLATRIGFGANTAPGENRNDVYITLEHGEFEKGNKSAAKNIEVTMKLINAQAEPLDRIHLSASAPPSSAVQSTVIYHNNTPRWGETFRLTLPDGKVNNTILVFYIRHCSSSSESRAPDKQSVFAYLKLVRDDGTAVANGYTDMVLYKYSLDCTKPYVFLNAPCTVKELSETTKMPLTLSKKESFAVRIEVCSTKLTQDHHLLALLKWKKHMDNLSTVLENVLKMNGRCVCLFMQDTFDALFSIIDQEKRIYAQTAFNAVTHCLNFIQQPEYEQFKSTLETYIENHFAVATVYKKLLSILASYIDHANEPDVQDFLLCAIQNFGFLMRFVVQSQRVHSSQTADADTDAFKEDVRAVMLSLIRFVRLRDSRLRPLQKTTFESVGNSIEELRSVFSDVELASILSHVVDAFPAEEKDHPLLVNKLSFMLLLIDNPLFSVPEARPALLSAILSNLAYNLRREIALDLVLEILSKVVSRLECNSFTAASDSCLLFSILPKLAPQLVGRLKAERFSKNFYRCLCSTVGILRIVDSSHYLEFMPTVEEPYIFIRMLFSLFRRLLAADLFGKSWNAFRLFQHKIVLDSLSAIASECLFKVPEGRTFNVDLIKAYFHIAAQLITQPCLQLETVHVIEADKLERQFGDMRLTMAESLVASWEALGESKKHFVPTLVDPVMRATLVKLPTVRRLLLPIIYDMLESDYHANKSIKASSIELFNTLDPIISKGSADYEFLSILEEVWLNKVAVSTTIPDLLRTLIRSLVARLVRLSSLLFDYKSLAERDVTSSDRRLRTLVLFNMVAFYKEHGPPKLHDASLQRLISLHLQENCWTEAAFTLLLLASGLEFSSKAILDSMLTFPIQTERNRKEALILKAIEYFGQGKDFESGIDLCDGLARWYRHEIYDYTKLRSVLETQALYFGHIIDELRPAREYFRVGYYGHGFPQFLRNKTFVYRGEEYEKLSSFQDRMLQDNNNVELMKSNQLPGEDITGSKKRHLQICTVRPVRPAIMEELESVHAHEHIQDFHRMNNASSFEYSRPYHRGPKDKDNEFKSLWLERICITTAWSLPGVLQWSEVVNTEVTQVSPIKNAVETMIAKNKELQQMIGKYHNQPGSNINPLSMALNGVIDAAVMGGTENYEKAFFVPKYAEENPEDVPIVLELKSLMVEQVGILEQGITVHKDHAPENLMPFHEKMEASFAVMKEKILLKYSPFRSCGSTDGQLDDNPPRPRSVRSYSPDEPTSEEQDSCAPLAQIVSAASVGSGSESSSSSSVSYRRSDHSQASVRMSRRLRSRNSTESLIKRKETFQC